MKGIRLTPAGKVFENTAYRVLREINAAAQRVAESTGLIAGEIRLGFVNSVNVCWLPKMIGRFLRQYPQVKFSVQSIDISELESRLLDEKLDLGVGFLENNRQSLKSLELFEGNLVAIANEIVTCVQEVTANSVLPEHACHWQAYPGIKVIPLSGDRWKRSVGLITPRVTAPLPAVSCFVDFLRASQPGEGRQ